MVEGIIIGLTSASITIGILAWLYNWAVKEIIAKEVFQQMKISLLQFSDMAQTIIIVFLGLGMGIGIVGSRISMKKYLEV